ncbi:uncharacterized protein LOC136031850 isoform X1 [Artemia franciscana]|uniref:uncharacterized protein LOC136031850 isoform X1 n=1 Tax=Artemia franciscana TaxID=6661 RepID=UPI0032DAE04B
MYISIFFRLLTCNILQSVYSLDVYDNDRLTESHILFEGETSKSFRCDCSYAVSLALRRCLKFLLKEAKNAKHLFGLQPAKEDQVENLESYLNSFPFGETDRCILIDNILKETKIELESEQKLRDPNLVIPSIESRGEQIFDTVDHLNGYLDYSSPVSAKDANFETNALYFLEFINRSSSSPLFDSTFRRRDGLADDSLVNDQGVDSITKLTEYDDLALMSRSWTSRAFSNTSTPQGAMVKMKINSNESIYVDNKIAHPNDNHIRDYIYILDSVRCSELYTGRNTTRLSNYDKLNKNETFSSLGLSLKIRDHPVCSKISTGSYVKKPACISSRYNGTKNNFPSSICEALKNYEQVFSDPPEINTDRVNVLSESCEYFDVPIGINEEFIGKSSEKDVERNHYDLVLFSSEASVDVHLRSDAIDSAVDGNSDYFRLPKANSRASITTEPSLTINLFSESINSVAIDTYDDSSASKIKYADMDVSLTESAKPHESDSVFTQTENALVVTLSSEIIDATVNASFHGCGSPEESDRDLKVEASDIVVLPHINESVFITAEYSLGNILFFTTVDTGFSENLNYSVFCNENYEHFNASVTVRSMLPYNNGSDPSSVEASLGRSLLSYAADNVNNDVREDSSFNKENTEDLDVVFSKNAVLPGQNVSGFTNIELFQSNNFIFHTNDADINDSFEDCISNRKYNTVLNQLLSKSGTVPHSTDLFGIIDKPLFDVDLFTETISAAKNCYDNSSFSQGKDVNINISPSKRGIPFLDGVLNSVKTRPLYFMNLVLETTDTISNGNFDDSTSSKENNKGFSIPFCDLGVLSNSSKSVLSRGEALNVSSLEGQSMDCSDLVLNKTEPPLFVDSLFETYDTVLNDNSSDTSLHNREQEYLNVLYDKSAISSKNGDTVSMNNGPSYGVTLIFETDTVVSKVSDDFTSPREDRREFKVPSYGYGIPPQSSESSFINPGLTLDTNLLSHANYNVVSDKLCNFGLSKGHEDFRTLLPESVMLSTVTESIFITSEPTALTDLVSKAIDARVKDCSGSFISLKGSKTSEDVSHCENYIFQKESLLTNSALPIPENENLPHLVDYNVIHTSNIQILPNPCNSEVQDIDALNDTKAFSIAETDVKDYQMVDILKDDNSTLTKLFSSKHFPSEIIEKQSLKTLVITSETSFSEHVKSVSSDFVFDRVSDMEISDPYHSVFLSEKKLNRDKASEGYRLMGNFWLDSVKEERHQVLEGSFPKQDDNAVFGTLISDIFASNISEAFQNLSFEYSSAVATVNHSSVEEEAASVAGSFKSNMELSAVCLTADKEYPRLGMVRIIADLSFEDMQYDYLDKSSNNIFMENCEQLDKAKTRRDIAKDNNIAPQTDSKNNSCHVTSEINPSLPYQLRAGDQEEQFFKDELLLEQNDNVTNHYLIVDTPLLESNESGSHEKHHLILSSSLSAGNNSFDSPSDHYSTEQLPYNSFHIEKNSENDLSDRVFNTPSHSLIVENIDLSQSASFVDGNLNKGIISHLSFNESAFEYNGRRNKSNLSEDCSGTCFYNEDSLTVSEIADSSGHISISNGYMADVISSAGNPSLMTVSFTESDILDDKEKVAVVVENEVPSSALKKLAKRNEADLTVLADIRLKKDDTRTRMPRDIFASAYTKNLVTKKEKCSCLCISSDGPDSHTQEDDIAAEAVPLIQVDGIAPSLETNSYIENRIDNLTDVEEITDSEGSEEETNNLQISKTARRKRTKKVFSLLSAPTNDEESLTDCEQIDVEEENVKTNATLAELPNFYKPLKPQIIEVVDDPSGKVQINKITSGIIVRELADIAAAGISVPLLDADLGADDPLTDMDSIDGVSDYDGPGMEVELEQAILSRYDISGNTSEIHEQGPVSFTPGIIIHPAGASSSSNLKLPTISNEATTDTEEFGGSDDESSQKGRLYVVERNLGNLTDTEDIELDAGTPERNRTPSPLNGPLRRSVELQRVSIEEDELGKVLIRTDATRDKTPSPYLSVQSEENEVLTDLESYAASDSEDEQPRFQTPEVEMFDGANINVHDKELLLKVDTMSDNGSDISNDMEVNTTLQVPSTGKQPLTDTEDIETSDIDERNITVRDIKKEFCVCIPLRKSLREKCICRSQDGSLVQLKDADDTDQTQPCHNMDSTEVSGQQQGRTKNERKHKRSESIFKTSETISFKSEWENMTPKKMETTEKTVTFSSHIMEVVETDFEDRSNDCEIKISQKSKSDTRNEVIETVEEKIFTTSDLVEDPGFPTTTVGGDQNLKEENCSVETENASSTLEPASESDKNICCVDQLNTKNLPQINTDELLKSSIEICSEKCDDDFEQDIDVNNSASYDNIGFIGIEKIDTETSEIQRCKSPFEVDRENEQFIPESLPLDGEEKIYTPTATVIEVITSPLSDNLAAGESTLIEEITRDEDCKVISELVTIVSSVPGNLQGLQIEEHSSKEEILDKQIYSDMFQIGLKEVSEGVKLEKKRFPDALPSSGYPDRTEIKHSPPSVAEEFPDQSIKSNETEPSPRLNFIVALNPCFEVLGKFPSDESKQAIKVTEPKNQDDIRSIAQSLVDVISEEAQKRVNISRSFRDSPLEQNEERTKVVLCETSIKKALSDIKDNLESAREQMKVSLQQQGQPLPEESPSEYCVRFDRIYDSDLYVKDEPKDNVIRTTEELSSKKDSLVVDLSPNVVTCTEVVTETIYTVQKPKSGQAGCASSSSKLPSREGSKDYEQEYLVSPCRSPVSLDHKNSDHDAACSTTSFIPTEYDTAHSCRSHTSQEYYSAVSSLSSKDSGKSIDSEQASSASFDHFSETTDTVLASSNDTPAHRFDITISEDFHGIKNELNDTPVDEDFSESAIFGNAENLTTVNSMKRSAEMNFNPEQRQFDIDRSFSEDSYNLKDSPVNIPGISMQEMDDIPVLSITGTEDIEDELQDVVFSSNLQAPDIIIRPGTPEPGAFAVSLPLSKGKEETPKDESVASMQEDNSEIKIVFSEVSIKEVESAGQPRIHSHKLYSHPSIPDMKQKSSSKIERRYSFPTEDDFQCLDEGSVSKRNTIQVNENVSLDIEDTKFEESGSNIMPPRAIVAKRIDPETVLGTTYSYTMSFEKEEKDITDLDIPEEDIEKEKQWIARQFDDVLLLHHDLEDIAECAEDGESTTSGERKDLDKLKESLSSTPDFDVLGGRKFFTKGGEFDDVSIFSLQEFERLEREMLLENMRRQSGESGSGSGDSINLKIFNAKGLGDNISVNSLTEFEKLEKQVQDFVRIEDKAKLEEMLLSEIEEGHESMVSESESCETISQAAANPNDGDDTDSEDYEQRMFEIEEIIRQAQTNIQQFDTTEDSESHQEEMQHRERIDSNEKSESFHSENVGDDKSRYQKEIHSYRISIAGELPSTFSEEYGGDAAQRSKINTAKPWTEHGEFLAIDTQEMSRSSSAGTRATGYDSDSLMSGSMTSSNSVALVTSTETIDETKYGMTSSTDTILEGGTQNIFDQRGSSESREMVQSFGSERLTSKGQPESQIPRPKKN